MAVVAAPAFMAFEAHVVNVTATIENALAVSTNSIDFGTVFPQEHLNQPLTVQLSGSFMTEERVDDVEYFIRQKPKCGVTTLDGQTLVEGSTATGHVIPTLDDDQTTDVDESKEGTAYEIDCGIAPIEFDTATQKYGLLPSLCEYISKEADEDVINDETTPSFHTPWTVSNNQVVWNDTDGYLAKSANDTVDNWIIDLAVPCFGGNCAQDWADFVHGINPAANPDDYTQDIANEHKVFGCDLWVEVSGVSEDLNRTIPLYQELGDGTTTLGPVQGHFTYVSAGTDNLTGTITVDSGVLTADHNYILVLNGPRGGGVAPGNTNDLLAVKACESDGGYDGWWVRQTDNTGATKCVTDLGDIKEEGYYNFKFNVTAAQLEGGYAVNVGLNDGNYNEVQLLVKDETTGWNTVLEYPGVGETDSAPSVFNFIVN